MRNILGPALITVLIIGATAPRVVADDTTLTTLTAPTPPVSLEVIRDLVRQQTALLEEVERMGSRIDRLVRAVREQSGGSPDQAGDVANLLAALDSEDHRSRVRATDALRRALVDRLWLLIETPDLTPEAQHRVKGLLSEASAMIGLTNVAVDLEPAQRDALWTLLDDDPDWVLAALGDEPERIREAIRNRPPEHDLAVEIVLAAIVANEMRPVARHIAVSEIHDASSGLLRDAMLDLLEPSDPGADPAARTFTGYREQAAVQAMRTLARRPSQDLIAHILAALQGATQWNVRYELFLVETLLDIGATNAIGTLHEIAEEKRARLNGTYRSSGLELKPGDCELLAAAKLLELDFAELEVIERARRSSNEPEYRGFAEPDQASPEREAAYGAVRRAMEATGPYPPIPEFERLRQDFEQGG